MFFLLNLDLLVREPNQNFRSSVAPLCEKDSGSFIAN